MPNPWIALTVIIMAFMFSVLERVAPGRRAARLKDVLGIAFVALILVGAGDWIRCLYL